MSLRLATFNLKDFFLPRVESERSVVEAKVANVVSSLRRANADILALQEIGSPELVDRVISETPELGYGPAMYGSEDRRGIRNAILSRRPILWSQVHRAVALDFPTFVVGDPSPFQNRIPLRRGVVHVRVDGGSVGEVDVLTTHFKSNLPSMQKTGDGGEVPDRDLTAAGASAVRSLVQRVAEALFVRRLVDDVFMRSPDHAICVMGDLNDTVDSLPVTLLRGVNPKHKCLLLPGAAMVAADQRFSCFHGNAPTLIDHILLSERLHQKLSRFEIHNEALRFHGPYIAEPPLTDDSDHALCLAILGE